MEDNRWKTAAKWMYENVYRDEQLPQRPMPAPLKLTPALRTARALERPVRDRVLPRAQLFYQQAKVLEHYEDDYVFPREAIHYYPTYASLTDEELRGYFGWRTRWRRGDKQKTSLSFAFIYIYELLHLIGCDCALNGFQTLFAFMNEYGALDPKILSYCRVWLRDMVIYYGLDPALLSELPEMRRDKALQTLTDLHGNTDEAIFDAALTLSGDAFRRSRFFNKFRETSAAVTAGTLRQVEAHYKAKTKKSWTDDYFGLFGERYTALFDAAVFCDRLTGRNCEVTLSGVRKYRCVNGRWSVYACSWGNVDAHRTYSLLRTVDSMLREAYGFPQKTKPGLENKWVLAAVNEEIEKRKVFEIERQKRTLRLDFRQLGAIRADAEITRDRLLTEEELASGPPTPTQAPTLREAPPPPPQAAADPVGAAGFAQLSPEENRYLRCQLTGEATDWLRSAGLMESVVCDSVNEKLFEAFGDTVLENGAPVEDYAEELKKGLGL